jgi:PQQ-like domain
VTGVLAFVSRSGRLAVLAVSVLAVGVALFVSAAGATQQAASTHDWTRFGWSAARSSAPTFATGITAANAGSLVRKQVQLEGTADSSPIYLHAVQVGGASHDVLFVTTTYGKTEAIDATSGAVLWTYTPAGYASWAGSAQITTATPVADPGRAFIYAASPGGSIVKLAVADGHAVWSVKITDLPSREKIASSLNFANGRVIATTGGYIGDAPPYQGHVALIDAKTGRLVNVWNSLCSNRRGIIDPPSCTSSDSAIWGRSGAVVNPANGDLLVATGNAPWNGKTDWGDAVLVLSPDASRLVGNYTPANTAELNSSDADLGSTSPVLLPRGYVAQGGKDGIIRVLSSQRISGTAPHQGGEIQTMPTPSGTDLFTAPAVLTRGTSTLMFAADNGGTAAYRFQNGKLQLIWKNGTGGTSPVVAGGLLWVYAPGGGLNVYTAATGHLVTTLQSGSGHWNSPIVIDGLVALPEGNANDHSTSGVLDIWHLR